MKISNTTLCNLEIFIGKKCPKRFSSNTLERLLSSVIDQSLCCQTPGNCTFSPCISSKESPEFWLDLHTNWWPQIEVFQDLKQKTAEGDNFPKIMVPGLYTLFLPLLLTSFYPLLSWKDNILIHISQNIAKGESLSDCWICHQKLWSVHDAEDPLVLSPTSLSLIPNTTASYTHGPMDATYWARLLQLDASITCFRLSSVVTTLAQPNTSTFTDCMTFTPASSFPYLIESVFLHQGKYRGSHIFAVLLGKTLLGWECSLQNVTIFWSLLIHKLEKCNQNISANKYIKN